jgi:hypothetical protein
MARYHVSRGNYAGTADDRIDRWYVDDDHRATIDHRGAGYRHRCCAEAAARDLEQGGDGDVPCPRHEDAC